MARRSLAVLTLLGLVAAAIWDGVAPPRSPTAYQNRASETAEAFRSYAMAADLWVRADGSGQVTHRATHTGLEELEADARGSLDRFAGWDPVPGYEETYTTLVGLGTDLVEALSSPRIAAHAGRWAELPAGARRAVLVEPPLTQLIDELGTS